MSNDSMAQYRAYSCKRCATLAEDPIGLPDYYYPYCAPCSDFRLAEIDLERIVRQEYARRHVAGICAGSNVRNAIYTLRKFRAANELPQGECKRTGDSGMCVRCKEHCAVGDSCCGGGVYFEGGTVSDCECAKCSGETDGAA